MNQVIEGEFKGKPTLSIKVKETEKFPFTFGVRKAHLIVEHIEQIKAFAAKHPATPAEA